MKKKKSAIIIISFIVLSLLVITIGLFVADGLPQKLSYKLNSFFSDIDIPVNGNEINNGNEGAIPVKTIEGNQFPEDMMAVWLELDEDVTSDPSYGWTGYLNEMALYYNYFDNFNTNTVFIKPDTEKRYSGLTDADGNLVDLLREYLNYAAAKNYTAILILDDDMIRDEDGKLTFDSAKYYLSNYAFHGVLLSSEASTEDERLYDAASYFSSAVKSYDKKLLFGSVVVPVEKNGYADKQTLDLLNGSLTDFILIKNKGSVISSSMPFPKVMTWWNALANNYPTTSFYVLHRADLVGGNTPGWGSAAELQDELRYMWDYNNLLGSVFYNSAALRENIGSSAQRAASLLGDDGSSDELKIQSLSLDSQNNTVTFSGTSAVGHPLTCNRYIAKENGGTFSVKYSLAAGGNSFSFFSRGKKLTYRIFNNVDTIDPYYQQTGIDAAYNDEFTFSPYKNNGLGTTLMCRIVNDDTEQLGPAGAYDTYSPDLSALCEGTLDYIDKMTVSQEGYIRYELRSGISVYGVNCELINNAYIMPTNTIKVSGVSETASSTDITFDTDWLVPVTVRAMPQSYHRAYLDYSYNIYSYTAEYVDIDFNYSGTFYNQALLTFAEDSPFTRSELYSGSRGDLILRLYLRKKGQFYGFDIRKDANSRLVLSFKKHASGDLNGKVIMLDPGHGGLAMTGTALSSETICEAQVTLRIADKVRQMLAAQGATVIMTRTLDTPLELDERTAMITKYNPDIFVSIHCDGSDNESDSGTHTFYFRSYSQPLADAINTSLVSSYANYIYHPGDTNYPAINRGIKYYPFFVTRLNQCPSVLVETGFMTNYVEGSILVNDNCQYWIAQGIAGGIINYFLTNNATV